MQSLQTAILTQKEKIHPGKTPIFIVASDPEDATMFALLLSSHLSTTRGLTKVQTRLGAHAHYFANPDTARVLNEFEKNVQPKTEQYREQLKLLLEEGRDNQKLWGLQCSYDTFFGLDLATLTKDAFFIFLCGGGLADKKEENEAEEPEQNDIDIHPVYPSEAYEFFQQHEDCCVLLHVNEISAQPLLVLENLPLAASVSLKDVADVHITLPEKIVHKRLSLLAAPENKMADAFKHSSLLLKNNVWFSGTELQFVFVLDKTGNEKILLDRIRKIALGFLYLPALHVICVSEQLRANMMKQLSDSVLKHLEIDCIAATNGIAAAVNAVVQQSEAVYISVDNLNISYSLADLLLPMRAKNAPVFSTVRLGISAHANGPIALEDVLTSHIVQDNIVCERTLWMRTKGFDATLGNDVFIWDFCIRALQITNGVASETIADIGLQRRNDDENIAGENLGISPGYKAIIDKHHALFQDSLNNVLRLVSQRQHLPQHEIKNLHYKIATLQTLLSHSKDELKSLNKLTAGLQQRIHQLENRWYHKLAHKANRFKKIFFKKKTPGTGTLKRILKFVVFTFSKPGIKIIRKVSKGGFKRMYLFLEDRPVKLVYLDAPTNDHNIETYHDWVKNKLKPLELKEDYDATIGDLSFQPKISIVMPVYDPPIKLLKEAIESVIHQLYGNWELCIADDCSPNPKVQKLLHVYAAKDSRIKVVFRKENGHISASSNSALEVATGDYILLMDHDDLLSANCTYEVVKHLNEHPDQDIIYSDEDKINEAGVHSAAHFKPDWAPHNLMSRNYFGHVVVIKKQIIDKIGGFRLGFEGSQDYDLLLRATELSQKIGHIPKVLYHWRIHNMSAAAGEDVKPYAYIAAKKALEEALVRRKTPGEVQYLEGLRGYRINYEVKQKEKVSIIIPTKDQVKLLKNTIDSILSTTDYPDYEIIVLNNNSSSKEFFELMQHYTQRLGNIFRCVDAYFPFNFSKLMNLGAFLSNGRYLLLLNNDVEVIHEDWLTRMVGYAQHEHAGAVGVKLLYPDDNIQHAGVIVGLGGVAGHAFVNFNKEEPGYFNYIQSVNNFSAVTAACLICRKEAYETVGGMDETFEVEYNDVDLCLKFIEHGYYNVYVPDVELYHYESATRGHPHQNKESWNRHVKEIKLFKDKWQKYIDHDPCYNPNLNMGAHDFSLNFDA